jgi:SAM-dependent methyltransferase
MPNDHPQFTASVPENYYRYMVPVLFRPFADSMAARIGSVEPKSVLELACGTGAVTRSLAASLPAHVRIAATDFSPDMLAWARKSLEGARSIEWQVADACALPFEDGSFDVIACQFGAMFFPDKAVAMAEALRTLSPGGHFLFSTWGGLAANPLFRTVEETLTALLPDEEPPFMPTPLSMSDPNEIRGLAKSAGFRSVDVFEESHTIGPHDPDSLASGFAFGTPLGLYLGGQGHDLNRVKSAIAAGFRTRLGDPVRFRMQALVCHATKA